MIPLPGVPTLFLDVKTPEDITDSKVSSIRSFSRVLVHWSDSVLLDPQAETGVAARARGGTPDLCGSLHSRCQPLEHCE